MIQIPSAIDLKNRYPEFTPVSDDTVEAMIAEASGSVDEGWEVSDQAPAILALAAHLMTQEGYPSRAVNPEAPLKATLGKEIVMRKVGDVTTQYAQSSSQSGTGTGYPGDLGTTMYGRKFAQLQKLNSYTIGTV